MPSLTTRKVNKFGKSTLAMTLLKAWVNYFKLEAGDRLEVIANKKLIVRPDRKQTNKEALD
jgi:phosphate uptake regulator